MSFVSLCLAANISICFIRDIDTLLYYQNQHDEILFIATGAKFVLAISWTTMKKPACKYCSIERMIRKRGRRITGCHTSDGAVQCQIRPKLISAAWYTENTRDRTFMIMISYAFEYIYRKQEQRGAFDRPNVAVLTSRSSRLTTIRSDDP